MILVAILSVLCACLLIDIWRGPVELTIRMKRQIGLTLTAFAAAMLILDGANPSEALTVDMDLIAATVLSSGEPAMVTLIVGSNDQSETLWVPLVVRLPMGGLLLWLSIILSALLFALPAIRGVEQKPVFAYLHTLPSLLTWGTFLVWLWVMLSGIEPSAFEAYLKEFDLGSVLSVNYPIMDAHAPLMQPVYFVVISLLVAGTYISVSSPRRSKSSAKSHSMLSNVALAGMLCLLVSIQVKPTLATDAQNYIFALTFLLAAISVIEKQMLLRVWSSIGCTVLALFAWLQV